MANKKEFSGIIIDNFSTRGFLVTVDPPLEIPESVIEEVNYGGTRHFRYDPHRSIIESHLYSEDFIILNALAKDRHLLQEKIQDAIYISYDYWVRTGYRPESLHMKWMISNLKKRVKITKALA